MWTFAHRYAPLAAALVTALTACANEPQAPTHVPPLFSHGGPEPHILGAVLGPDGSSICNFLPPASTVLTRVIEAVDDVVAGAQNLTCPANEFSIPIAAGAYRIRVQMPADPAISPLPWRYLKPGDVEVADVDVVQDVQVQNGVPLGGSVTYGGAPVPDWGLTLLYDELPPFGAAVGVSGADGEWDETRPGPMRSSLLLQGGVRYRRQFPNPFGCPVLGGRLLSTPPPASFVFPDEVSRIDCTVEPSLATQFSHHLTSLVVTPMPGDIGGQGGALFEQFGRGWGVQFPVGEAGPSPAGPNHLFSGGLLIGIAPNVVLSAVDIGSYNFECQGSCIDLGLDGELTYEAEETSGTKVTWSYTDAHSELERQGLRVIQRSFDGQPPADYVLFDFSIRNIGKETITFYAGFFGDWDVGQFNAQDDDGFTELGGRLMYATDEGETGVHVGTFFPGDIPISGTYFFNSDPQPLNSRTDQVDALRGVLVRTSIAPPGDLRVIHAVGPITLPPQQTKDVWLAVVAGEDKAQILDNSAAAEGDIAVRRLVPPGGPMGSSGVTVRVRPELVNKSPVAPAKLGGQPQEE